MKAIDKVVKILLGIGLSLVLLTGGLIVYVLAFITSLYRYIRGQVDFVKEFQDINKEFINSIKTYIHTK